MRLSQLVGRHEVRVPRLAGEVEAADGRRTQEGESPARDDAQALRDGREGAEGRGGGEGRESELRNRPQRGANWEAHQSHREGCRL